MDAQQPAAPKTLSKSALVGFILSVIGICFFPLAVVGLVLGIIGLVSTSQNPLRSGKGLAIASVVIAPVALLIGIFILGPMVAIAIPSFIKYQHRSMTVEARANLRVISRAVEMKLAETNTLPPSLPRTPAEVPCGKKPARWPSDANPGWRDLGFAPDTPVRFSYEYIAGPGQYFTVRAYGDLSCDGKTSVLEMSSESGEIRGDGELN